MISIGADFIDKVAAQADKQIWALGAMPWDVARDISRYCMSASEYATGKTLDEMSELRDLTLKAVREHSYVWGFWSWWAEAVLLSLAWLRHMGHYGSLGLIAEPIHNPCAGVMDMLRHVQGALVAYFGLADFGRGAQKDWNLSAGDKLEYHLLDAAFGVAAGMGMPALELLEYTLQQNEQTRIFERVGKVDDEE